MEVGECSRTVEDGDSAWGKLVPADDRYSGVDVISGGTVIHSEVIYSSNKKQSWCIISKIPDTEMVEIKNISQTPIIVDNILVGKKETARIRCGSEIVSGPHKEGYLVFHFKERLPMKLEEKAPMIHFDVEHAKCGICLSIWHDVVTVSPCLHNFCNGCLSEWLGRSKKITKCAVCPQCRCSLHSAGRNHFLRNIEEAILLTSPSLRRSGDELETLDKRASIQSTLVLGAPKRMAGKVHSRISHDENQPSSPICPQCRSSIGGFGCNQSTQHLQCHACSGMVPSRADTYVPVWCLGCDRSFCGAYWSNQGLVPGGENRICSPETFQPVSRWRISSIPDIVHEKNLYEQDITTQCIRQTGKRIPEIISEWIIKFDNSELDWSTLKLKNPEAITSETYLCRDCYDKFVDFLLYWFRLTLPPRLLPEHAANREDCWYGYACRTQHTNHAHARKRNHVCRPTRG